MIAIKMIIGCVKQAYEVGFEMKKIIEKIYYLLSQIKRVFIIDIYV